MGGPHRQEETSRGRTNAGHLFTSRPLDRGGYYCAFRCKLNSVKGKKERKTASSPEGGGEKAELETEVGALVYMRPCCAVGESSCRR